MINMLAREQAKRFHQTWRLARLASHMIVQRVRQQKFRHRQFVLINNNLRHNKDDIMNVTKAVARKSILMQIAKAKVASGFLQISRQDCRINVNKFS
jgi:S-adenosylmethionine:tRNA-ribosyltransferase-isomerase (queuine synthetase)